LGANVFQFLSRSLARKHEGVFAAVPNQARCLTSVCVGGWDNPGKDPRLGWQLCGVLKVDESGNYKKSERPVTVCQVVVSDPVVLENIYRCALDSEMIGVDRITGVVKDPFVGALLVRANPDPPSWPMRRERR
jgi:hypothetical protein